MCVPTGVFLGASVNTGGGGEEGGVQLDQGAGEGWGEAGRREIRRKEE